MLILTRKPGESVVIGNSVRLTVIESSSGSVRLGLVAPAEVSIYREELYDEIANANLSAAEQGRRTPPDGVDKEPLRDP